MVPVRNGTRTVGGATPRRSTSAAQVARIGADREAMQNTPARVLVAEDSATQRAVCVNLLRDAGLEVHEAPDGRYALDICRIIRPDLLVLDLGLPRLNGLDLLRKLRDDRKIGRTPVIIVTADEREETAQAAYYEGATDLVHKPVDGDDLIVRVQEALAVAAA
jgi:CheY-like chemotaxis protein